MKTLVLDIETIPNLGYFWGLWDQNIPINMIEVPQDLLCFSAKWLGKKEVMFERGDDMVLQAWGLLDEADAVIHYNGKRFDIPWLNTMFQKENLGPPSPFKQIDLCNVVKQRFKLPSNKLQYVATWLELPGKEDPGGWKTWKGCIEGDPKAWKTMEKYNKQDVRLTEQVYHALLPWIGNHPSIALHDETYCCPKCGGSDLMKRGFAVTQVSKYQRYQCLDCNSYFRDTKRLMGVPIVEAVL